VDDRGRAWLVDGNEFYVKTVRGVQSSGRTWVFEHPFYILLNLAVGSGIFEGPPGADTVFPQQMLIDYVSVATPTPATP